MDADQENHFDEEDIDDQDKVISGSTSSDSGPKKLPEKQCLKIKIPILKKQSDVKQRICHVCGKEFSSGKAYGGHVRIHMKGSHQNKKIRNLNKNSNKIGKKKQVAAAVFPPCKGCSTIKAGDLNLCDGKFTCSLCSKDFQSVHSLFGHMKRHPERGWRGVRPPPTSEKNNSFCSSVSENEVGDHTSNSATGAGTDLLKGFPNWSVTAKRGKPISDEIPEAAYLLTMLKRGELRGSDHQSDSSLKKMKLDDTGNSGWITTKSTKEVRKSGTTLGRNLDKGKRKVDYQDAVSVKGKLLGRPQGIIIGPKQPQSEGKFRDFERTRNDEKVTKKTGKKQVKNPINRSLIAEGKTHLTTNSRNFGVVNKGHKNLLMGSGKAEVISKALDITSYQSQPRARTFPVVNKGHQKLLMGPGEAAGGSKALEITSYQRQPTARTFPVVNQGHQKLLMGPGEAAGGSKSLEITSYQRQTTARNFPVVHLGHQKLLMGPGEAAGSSKDLEITSYKRRTMARNFPVVHQGQQKLLMGPGEAAGSLKASEITSYNRLMTARNFPVVHQGHQKLLMGPGEAAGSSKTLEISSFKHPTTARNFPLVHQGHQKLMGPGEAAGGSKASEITSYQRPRTARTFPVVNQSHPKLLMGPGEAAGCSKALEITSYQHQRTTRAFPVVNQGHQKLLMGPREAAGSSKALQITSYQRQTARSFPVVKPQGGYKQLAAPVESMSQVALLAKPSDDQIGPRKLLLPGKVSGSKKTGIKMLDFDLNEPYGVDNDSTFQSGHAAASTAKSALKKT